MNEQDESMIAYVRYRLEKAQETYCAPVFFSKQGNGIL